MSTPAASTARPEVAGSGIGAATIVLSLTTIVSHTFGRQTYGLLIPAIEDSFGLTHGQAGVGGTVVYLAYFVGVLVVMWASARVEPITIMRVGLALGSAGLALNAVAPNRAVLFGGLALAGGAGAGIWITAPTLATNGVAVRRRGMVIGLLASSIGAASFLVGIGTSAYRAQLGVAGSWRPVWAVEATLAAALLVATLTVVRPEPTEAVGARGISLGLLRAMPGWWQITLAYTLFAVVGAGFSAFVVAALEEDAGLSRSQAGVVFAVMGLLGALGAPLTGWLSDRLGRRPLLISSISALGLASTVVALGTGPMVVSAAIVFGAQAGSFPSMIASYVRDHADARAFSQVFSTMLVSFSATAVVAPVGMGWLADRSGSFTTSYLVLSGAAAVTLACVLALPRRAGADGA